MRKHSLHGIRASLLLTTCLCGMTTELTAQDAGEFTDLGTIYIQADGRGEDIKEQPRAMSVIQADTLPQGEIESGAGIATGSPGVVFSGFGQPGTDFVKIRGVGALGYPLSASDQLVAFSVDEVPTSALGFPPTLFDMEQIEVLRGPQGTLFGRNALAGGVNFVTAKADGERIRKFGIAAGSDGYINSELVFGDWIAEDRVAIRAALRFSDYDGAIPNTNAGGELGGASAKAGRLSLAAYTENGWDISLMLQADEEERHNSFQILYENPDYPVSGESRVPSNSRENKQAVLRLERDFEAFKFTSITGYQSQKLEGISGYYDIYLYSAFTGLPPSSFVKTDEDFFQSFLEDEKIFSQEFRLSSHEDSLISWVAGLNYMWSDYHGVRTSKDDFNPSSNGVTDVTIETKTWSIFADATWPVSDRLRLSGGLRYGSEKQSVDGNYVSNGFPGTVASYAQSHSISDTSLTGRLGLSYDFNDELTGYFSASHGYAAGGYEKLLIGSATGVATLPFAPATNNAFEAGLKYRSNDGAVNATVSAFYNDVKDGQIFAYAFSGPSVVYFFDNQDYRTYGLEADADVQISSDLTLRGSLALLNSKFVNVQPTSTTGAVNGNKVPLAPDVTATLGLDYNIDATRLGLEGDMTFSADWSYVGKRQADQANSFEIPAYDLVNLRLGWKRGNTSAFLFANNVFDKRPIYYASTYTPDAHAVSVGQGRVIGLGFTTEF